MIFFPIGFQKNVTVAKNFMWEKKNPKGYINEDFSLTRN